MESNGYVTHALVEFIDENCPGVVPLHRITEKEFQAGDQVTIVWTDKKQYAATQYFQVIICCLMNVLFQNILFVFRHERAVLKRRTTND